MLNIYAQIELWSSKRKLQEQLIDYVTLKLMQTNPTSAYELEIHKILDCCNFGLGTIMLKAFPISVFSCRNILIRHVH